MSHTRKFVPGSVGLIKGKVRYSGSARRPLHDFTEKLVIQSGMLNNAPFQWVSVAYLHGVKNSKPNYYKPPIDKEYQCVELKIEIKMEVLQAACNIKSSVYYEQKKYVTTLRIKTLRQIYYVANLEMLIDVCKKYHLAGLDRLQAERIKYKDIPDNEAEVEALGDLGLLKQEYEGQGLIEDLVDPLENKPKTAKANKIYSDGDTVYSIKNLS